MRQNFRVPVLQRDYDSILAAIIGYWIIQLFARHSGIGISPDSVTYISTADNILRHGAITDFSGWPMMDFPAGYPIFLAGIKGITHVEIRTLGAVLNGLTFGALIFTSGWLMERASVRNRGYKWAMLAIIVLSPCLLEVYSMLWSETLFLWLILLFIAVIRPYLLTPSWRRLIAPTVIAALACATRYAGISLIMLGGGLIISIAGFPWRKKIPQLLFFGIGASSLFLLNIYRNHRVTGTLTGFREKAITGLGANIYHFGTVLCDWLPFFDQRYALATFLAVFFIVIAAVGFIRRCIRKDIFTYENLGAGYFLLYAVFILTVASISRFQQLDSRLLSPLFVPWLWSFTTWIPGWLERLKTISRLGRWTAVAVLVIAAACMEWGQYQTFEDNWEGIKYAGIPGYTEDSWRDSPTLDFVRHNTEMHRPYAPLYSNAYDGIWFLTGVRADLLPHREFGNDINEMLAQERFWVIWFNDSVNKDLVSIEFIRKHTNLLKVYTFEDGSIYLFTH